MVCKILDGYKLANSIKQELAERLKNELSLIKAHLTTILVGDDPASETYIKNKHQACKEVGIRSSDIRLPHKTSTEELVKIIDELNSNIDVTGILVQLPLPKHIDKYAIVSSIHPFKDVDGLHPFSLGDNFYNISTFVPCTPKGIFKLLNYHGISELTGKHIVIIGTSEIVGKPLAILASNLNATVTLCNIHTTNLSDHVKNADIIVTAIGKLGVIDTKWLSAKHIIIDVGINRDFDNKLCGDIDFDQAEKVVKYITPVPGGVGPMTVAMLLENTVISAILQTDAANTYN